MRGLHEQVTTQMRVLHEDVIARIAPLNDTQRPSRKPRRKR
jgi:hypothetical protein